MNEMSPPETAKRSKPKAKTADWRIGANTFDNKVIIQAGGKPLAIDRESAQSMIEELQAALRVLG